MPTPRVLSISSPGSTPAAARVGKLASLALLAGSLALLAPVAHADDLHTFVGAGVGAVAGAAIGQSMGGRNGAILGAGAGGLVGASIANQGHAQHYPGPAAHVYVRAPAPVTYYQPPVTYYQAPVVAWQAPQLQYRYAQPVSYYQQPVVAWQPPQHQPQYWREGRRHGHHHGHRDDHGGGRHQRREY